VTTRRFTGVLVGVAVIVTAWTAASVGARASYGARTTGDEPHYLITAISLADDRSLTVGDEIAERTYLPFHEQTLWNQATPLDDGRLVEPHDPLLPAVLAVPVAVGGWVAGKLALAVLAGLLAASLTWIAVRRFEVGVAAATTTVLAFALAMPLSAYANQVYPELPAALAVTLALGALTGRLGRAGIAGWLLALVALPWLSVKYVPVALVLAAVGAVMLWRRGGRGELAVSAVVLAAAGVLYLVAHQVLYGGLTVYAAGGHFVEGGQLSVMGYEANYPGRSIRLLGLLIDRRFGLAAWAPVYLLAVPALAALLRARPRGWPILVLPLVAAWLNATWIAQTMHGWWSPGRQVVVALPAVVLAVAWWVGRVRVAIWPLVALASIGLVNAMWLVIEASTGRRTLVVDFFETANPLYRAGALLLPDGARGATADIVAFVVWGVALAGLAVLGWRSVPAPSPVSPDPTVVVHPRKEHPTCSPSQAASLV
jgi:hypothetical protein